MRGPVIGDSPHPGMGTIGATVQRCRPFILRHLVRFAVNLDTTVAHPVGHRADQHAAIGRDKIRGIAVEDQVWPAIKVQGTHTRAKWREPGLQAVG